MSKHCITFINKLTLPVNLETWQTKIPGLSEYNEFIVNAGDTITTHSETGEWFVSNAFYIYDINKQWINSGFTPGFQIGKIRDLPCFKGNYVWLYRDDFIIDYNTDNQTAVIYPK
jgi:hypothetical protein